MKRHGLVMLVVLVVVAMASVVGLTLLFRMRAEIAAAGAATNGEQAYSAAMSGLQRAQAVLQAHAAEQEIWYDNPDLFSNQLVWDDGANRWYFTIYAGGADDPKLPRFGISDEASKINVNVAPESVLTKLADAVPGVTKSVVNCILDYRDPGAKPRDDGAKQDYYDTLKYPYLIKNGPFSTIEEMLLVKGVNGPILYGEDANFNGILDPNEDDGDDSFPPDDSDGKLNTGLLGILTTRSYDKDVDSAGKPRISLNGDPQAMKKAGLSDQTVKFIAVYRAEGNVFKSPAELLNLKYQLKGDSRDGQLKAGSSIESGVGAEQLPLVMDKLTAFQGGGMLPGLVNINTASAKVLAMLPGLDNNLAQRIVDARSGLDPASRGSTAWLFTQNVVSADAFKAIAPLLTARSMQFRVMCVGFGAPCGRYRVLEAVFDLGGTAPRMLYLRDLTQLGLPLAIDVQDTTK